MRFQVPVTPGTYSTYHPVIVFLSSVPEFGGKRMERWNSPLPHRDMMALINLSMILEAAVRTGLVNSPRWHM